MGLQEMLEILSWSSSLLLPFAMMIQNAFWRDEVHLRSKSILILEYDSWNLVPSQSVVFAQGF